ncbi:MAG: hypothetical protein JO006_07150 [Paucibacter sp.]|nr:hypothetical protein [Roseateles sp.]
MKSQALPLNPLNTLDDWRRAEPTAAMQAATLAAARRAVARRRGLPAWAQGLAALLPMRPTRPTRPVIWASVASCALGLLGTLLVFSVPLPQTAQAEFSASAFVPLVSEDRLQHAMDDKPIAASATAAGAQAREGRAWVVTTEMPAERLALLGLPYDPSSAGQSVRAELLMRPNGEVLAVRLVH